MSKISRGDLVSKSGFPYVKFGGWLKYLVESDLLQYLVGTNDLEAMRSDEPFLVPVSEITPRPQHV